MLEEIKNSNYFLQQGSSDFYTESLGTIGLTDSGVMGSYTTTSDTHPYAETFFPGSQEGCWGAFDRALAEDVRQKILEMKEKGIDFGPIEDNFLYGGTCSAMALDFIEFYRTLKAQNDPADVFLKKLKEMGARRYRRSSAEMRARQAAFNCIRVDLAESEDPSKDKIQSLANFHDFKIDHFCEEFKSNDPRLKEAVANLPYGVYLVRMRHPANNQKQELFGHSMVFVHDPEYTLFYDPNEGVENLSGIKDAEEWASHVVQTYMACWYGAEIRCYRIAEENPPSNLKRLQAHGRV